MDRFHKNVSALSELCDTEDEVQLQKVAEGLDERFSAARDAVQQRAEALESAIEQSSQFSDRLDVILSNLDGAAVQVIVMRLCSAIFFFFFLTRTSVCSSFAVKRWIDHSEVEVT